MSKLDLRVLDTALDALAEAVTTEKLASGSPQAKAFFGKLVGRGDSKNYDDPRASSVTYPIPRTPAWRERRSNYGRKPGNSFDPTKMQKPRRLVKRSSEH